MTEAPAQKRKYPLWLVLLIGRRPLLTLLRIIFLGAACWVVFQRVLVPIRVTGDSMHPTYRNGRINFVNVLSYRRKEPARGDIVAVKILPGNLIILKRIVGMPGETVRIREGQIYINDQLLAEPYIHNTIPWKRPAFNLGEDQYFVIGDNREISDFKVANRPEILGKLLY